MPKVKTNSGAKKRFALTAPTAKPTYLKSDFIINFINRMFSNKRAIKTPLTIKTQQTKCQDQ